MTLATTVSLPVIRGPAQLAKTLAAIDILSDGRLVVGVGPGSSARDYAAAGISFDERWPRFDEAIPMLRALLAGDQAFEGTSTRLVASISSRGRRSVRHRRSGSPPGARRPAFDGWREAATAGSRPPTTPPPSCSAKDSHAWRRRWSRRAGQSRSQTPSATAWLYVTEDIRRAERMLADVLAPLLGRPVEELRSLSLPIGPAEVCAERLAAFADAGAQRLFVWPLRDEVRQLELFRERVVPMLR